MTKKDIVEILSKERSFLRNHFGISRIAIFGSFANDTASEQSDVDIYVECARPLGLKFIQMVDYLEHRLGRKIDVLTPGGIAGIRIKQVAQRTLNEAWLMSKRGDLELLSDILEAGRRIMAYGESMSYQQFSVDTKTQDAVIRNFDIIGEAAKNVSQTMKDKYQEVAWSDGKTQR